MTPVSTIYNLPVKHLTWIKTKVTLAMKRAIVHRVSKQAYDDWDCRDIVTPIFDYLLVRSEYESDLKIEQEPFAMLNIREEIWRLAYDNKDSYYNRYKDCKVMIGA